RGVSAAARAAGLAGRAELRDALTRQMAAAGIDAWISPAAPGPAPLGLDATGAPWMNLPWTHAGLPAVALPAGTVEGMPVGVQVVARAGDDERLLAWALDIEAALR
ncbi:MAG: amidase family protein, partial [Chloroflexota bacterium]|nr:amidase family protein [Chloroflexota bacterium]